MKQYGDFEYTLRDETGYFVDIVNSQVALREGDEICYKGNKLLVVREDSDNSVTVRKTGSIIVVG